MKSLAQSELPPLSPDMIRDVVAASLVGGHFFAGPGMSLDWEHLPAEDVAWEIFQGRLLDRAHTRQTRTFEAWNIYSAEGGTRSGEPLLAVKLDLASGELHVTRGLLCYVWEGYHAGDNVYLSRETTRWVRELVGTIPFAGLCDADELRDELTGLLFAAVVGISRLPLTSVEAPLPAFAMGQIAYFYRRDARQDAGPMRSWRDFLAGALTAERSWAEKARLLEVLLRATPADELGEAERRFVERWRELGHSAEELPRLLRTVFNDVSLSPWSNFVEKALTFVHRLVDGGHLTVAAQADFLGYLLRQAGRHLTAYDLVTFHHRGANYPDALLLDLVLKDYVGLIERQPDLFSGEDERGRLRRRALRQGWLLRRHYEGHLVPDAPTSPGENARVLPAPHRRVPDEQILDTRKRTRRLYENDPLSVHLGEHARRRLRQSLDDLHNPAELRELGMAVFIDRPLGVFKPPAEPNRTVLLSYEAFSKALAARRLAALARDEVIGLAAEESAALRRELEALSVAGIPVNHVGDEPRPVVSVADALKVSDDFMLLRTLPRGVREFLGQYDFSELRRRFDLSYPDAGRPVLLVRGRREPAQAPTLVAFDEWGRGRLELEIGGDRGYEIRGGVERPANGLRVRALWSATDEGAELVKYDLRAEGLVVGPPPEP